MTADSADVQSRSSLRRGTSNRRGVVLRYRTAVEGATVEVPLGSLAAQTLDPVEWLPYRELPRYRGQVSRPGLYWFPSMGRFVGYESRLEMLTLTRFDRDPKVVGVASQPFEFDFGRSKAPKRHVPDYALSTSSGDIVIVDVKREALLTRADVAAQFDLTRQVCDSLRWRYDIATEPSPAMAANLRWLAGYRLTPAYADVVAPLLIAAAAEPAKWGALVTDAAQSTGLPAFTVLPVLAHLVWSGLLTVELESPLSASSIVKAGASQ